MGKPGTRRRYSVLVPKVQALLRDELGQLTLDQSLPAEYQLAEKYGVSRKTVRSAMAVLEKEGQVQRIRGRGTFPARGALASPLFRRQFRKIGIGSGDWIQMDRDHAGFYAKHLSGAIGESGERQCQDAAQERILAFCSDDFHFITGLEILTDNGGPERWETTGSTTCGGTACAGTSRRSPRSCVEHRCQQESGVRRRCLGISRTGKGLSLSAVLDFATQPERRCTVTGGR